MMRYRRAVLGLLGSVFRSSSGSTLLWMIGALVVLGSVAAGVALMSPSASRGKLEQEAGMRAYYNANAGLQFLNSVSYSAENAQINFTNFTSQMGGTGIVTYTMPDNGTFSYQLGNFNTNGVNGTYQITNLIGTVQDANDKSAYLYSIYGGGKGSSVVFDYKPVIENSTNKYKDAVIITSGYVDIQGSNDLSRIVVGDIQAGSLNIEHMEVDGDIYSGGVTSIDASDTIIKGNVCSDDDIEVSNGAKIEGDIRSNGYITVDKGSDGQSTIVTGSLTSSKAVDNGGVGVTIGGQGTVGGDVNSVGSVVLYYKSFVGGSVYTDNGIILTGGGQEGTSPSISGSAYASGYYGNNKNSIGLGIKYQNGSAGGFCSIKKDAIAIGDIILVQDSYVSGNKDAYASKDDIKTPSGLSFSCKTSIQTPNMTDFSDPSKLPGMTATKKADIDCSNIKPGWYSNFPCKGSEITFTAGTYYFDSLEIANNYSANINLDVTNGDILIFVGGEAKISNAGGKLYVINGSSKKLFSEADQDLAAKVYLEAHGDINVSWGVDWFGTLFSTKDVTLGGDNLVIGVCATTIDPSVSKSYKQEVSVGWDSRIIYVQSNYSKKYW